MFFILCCLRNAPKSRQVRIFFWPISYLQISPAYDPNSKDTWNSHAFCVGTHWKSENAHQCSSPKTELRHHRKKTETLLKQWTHHWHKARDITDISPKHRRDKTNTSLPHHPNQTDTSLTQTRDITETSLTHHRDKTETSQKTSPRHHWNSIETAPRRHGDIPETRPHNWDLPETFKTAYQNNTETSPRQGSIIRRHTAHSILPQLHWFAQKGAQYSNSNWIFRFCLETRSKCSSMFIPKKIKTPSPKQKKTAQQHQRHNTKPSPTHHNITAPSPNITETSPKHARDVTNTSLNDPQNTAKLQTKQHQNNTETSPKKDRDKTETSQTHHQNNTETSPRQHRDKTKTRPRHDRDMTETSQRHHQNNNETSPRQDRDKTKTRKHHPSTYGPRDFATATLVCPKEHNIQIQIGILDFV